MSKIRPFDYLNSNRLKPKQGRLLLSEPFLPDPYFKRAVVLLAEHNEKGSLGFMMNKSIHMKVSDAVVGFPDFPESLYFGGPVNRDLLFYIHTVGDKIEGSVEISEELYWGGDFEAVKKLIIADELKQNQIKFFVGYSGWSEGQLEGEMKQKSWIVAKPEVKRIMTGNAETLWKDTLVSLGKEYSIIANFPEDPGMN